MWRTLRRLILETGDNQISAMGALEEANTIAVEIQRYRAAGFSLVEQISQESADAEARDLARRALNQFVLAEGLLVRIAAHLNQGLERIDIAQTATLQAMTLVRRRGEES